MNKANSVLLIFLSILMLCSCADDTLSEGNLLYDCGIESIEDIESCKILSGASFGEFTITNKDEFKVFSSYEYAEDYPTDKLHELFLFPGVYNLTITANGKEVIFYLFENGDIGVAPTKNSPYKLYRANFFNRLTQDKADKLVVKYGGEIITEN